MTKPTNVNPLHRLANLGDAWEGPPSRTRTGEYDFQRADREARELIETADRIRASNRDRNHRKSEYAAFRPRFDALRGMAREAFAHRGIETASTRLEALRRHVIYQALPESERRAWDELLPTWVETIETGDLGSVLRDVDHLAGTQAGGDALATWSPPAIEAMSPSELAALIPRG